MPSLRWKFTTGHAQSSPGLGLVTVYRTLEKLEELGLIQRVHQTHGCQAFIASGNGHEHLLLCTKCGLAVRFSGDELDPLIQSISHKTGYKVEEHWLQLFGLCDKCKKWLRNDQKAIPCFNTNYLSACFLRTQPEYLLLLHRRVCHACLASTSFLADIAQNVAGDRFVVESLLPLGIDPHAYQPKPADAAKVAASYGAHSQWRGL